MEQVKYSNKISEKFAPVDLKYAFEPAFQKWLMLEIDEGRLSVSEVFKRFDFNPNSFYDKLNKWRDKYADELVVLNLPSMTAKERIELEALRKQLKAAEEKLVDAQLTNVALNTMIDVAEEKLKISIRKKSGAKQ